MGERVPRLPGAGTTETPPSSGLPASETENCPIVWLQGTVGPVGGEFKSDIREQRIEVVEVGSGLGVVARICRRRGYIVGI